MVIHKILNNNLILSRDGQGHEVIVKGCGIAFQKKKGHQVEESRIEKIFTAENKKRPLQYIENLFLYYYKVLPDDK